MEPLEKGTLLPNRRAPRVRRGRGRAGFDNCIGLHQSRRERMSLVRR